MLNEIKLCVVWYKGGNILREKLTTSWPHSYLFNFFLALSDIQLLRVVLKTPLIP